jgi:hypothetical protein
MPSVHSATSRLESFGKRAGVSLTRLIAVVEYRAALELDTVEAGSLLRLAEHRYAERRQQRLTARRSARS